MLNTVIHGDSAVVLQSFEDECIDLTVTSPPYDSLRTYNGYVFDFETIAKQLFRVTKKGGVVVWVVSDQVVNGKESLTSCKQKIFFAETCGFTVHDTMIYKRKGSGLPHDNRYGNEFEYVFILSVDVPKCVNIIKDRLNSYYDGKPKQRTVRERDGKTYPRVSVQKRFAPRGNVWEYHAGMNLSTKDAFAFEHPAIFPENLARDHIISWSNEGDTVLDCFAGSGTTLKMAKMLNRNYVGIEISSEYVSLIEKRLRNTPVQESFLIHSNEVVLRE